MFNRRNFLGLASAVSFIASAPRAIASAIARGRTIRGTVLSANRANRTFELSGGYAGLAGYGYGGGSIPVHLGPRAKVKVRKNGRTRRGGFNRIVEAAEGNWRAEVKGRLNGAGDEMTARKVLLIEPSYGY
jgi:hypothetical protein